MIIITSPVGILANCIVARCTTWLMHDVIVCCIRGVMIVTNYTYRTIWPILYSYKICSSYFCNCVEKTTVSVKAIWQALLHYGALCRMINSVVSPQETLKNMVTKFNTRLRLTKEAETNLWWWMSLERQMILEASLLPWTLNMII